MKKYRILIIEDVESILLAIKDYLRPFYSVEGASSSREAQTIFYERYEANTPFDFVLSDIHLPDGSGLDLIHDFRQKQKNLKTAIITSYDINEYIDYIQKFKIDQVISKHSKMSLRDIHVMIEKTLSKNIFGVDKYFKDLKIYYPTSMKRSPWPKNREIYSVQIKSTEDRVYWTDHISQMFFEQLEVPASLTKLVLDELTTNAMVRAPRHEDGSYKYQKKVPFEDKLIPDGNVVLAPEDYFTVQYGFYDDWIILTSIDPNGTLRKEEILYRLRRHLSTDTQTGLPEGLNDTHGRGLFLLREHLSHIIFNIEINKKTEIICLYNRQQNTPYKNISIFEIERGEEPG